MSRLASLQAPLLMLVALALAVLWALGLRRLEERVRAGALSPLVSAAGAAASLAGAVAIAWHSLAAEPYGDAGVFALRPGVVVAAALGGSALAGQALAVRTAGLALASALFLAAAVGPLALAVNLCGFVPGYFAERWLGTHRPRATSAVHAALLLGTGVVLCVLRPAQPVTALAGFGIYSFAALRHLSFTRCARSAGAPFPSVSEYLLYLLFFPNCVGAMEVFDEFRDANLRQARNPDLGRAFARTVLGAAQVSVAFLLDASLDRVLAAEGFLAAWGQILLLFVRSALGVMGFWSILESTALFLGVQLRPNFRGILLAANPSEFWHAWRGTMTRWLITNVYIPLGGSHRNRMRNVAAVFLVSTLWHAAGTAFLLWDRALVSSLMPLVAWGGLSFAGVALHARLRRAPVERPPLAAACVRALKIGGTWVYGSFTVTLLELALGDPARSVLFVKRILGF